MISDMGTTLPKRVVGGATEKQDPISTNQEKTSAARSTARKGCVCVDQCRQGKQNVQLRLFSRANAVCVSVILTDWVCQIYNTSVQETKDTAKLMDTLVLDLLVPH